MKVHLKLLNTLIFLTFTPFTFASAINCPSISQTHIQEVYNSHDNAGLTIQGKQWGARLNRSLSFDPNQVVITPNQQMASSGFCNYSLFEGGKKVGTLVLHFIN